MRPDPRFPWHRLSRKESFFVPTLDLRATELAGIQAAYRTGIRRVTATPCIYKGLLGVMLSKPEDE